jgi:hypothetical protein
LRLHERLLVDFTQGVIMANKPINDPLREALLRARPRHPGFRRVWNPATKMYEDKVMTPAEQLRASSSR